MTTIINNVRTENIPFLEKDSHILLAGWGHAEQPDIERPYVFAKLSKDYEPEKDTYGIIYVESNSLVCLHRTYPSTSIPRVTSRFEGDNYFFTNYIPETGLHWNDKTVYTGIENIIIALNKIPEYKQHIFSLIPIYIQNLANKKKLSSAPIHKIIDDYINVEAKDITETSLLE